jgi:X-X-X-Leu-X-X-Gly heptad repeat protein
VASLQDGLADYKDGTAQLRDGTGGMDDEISSMIDKILAEITGREEVRSFVSDKNTYVTSVQFVLRTGTIEAPQETSDDSVQTEEPTLWEKLLALFGM